MGGFDFKGQSRTTGRLPSGIHQLASRNQPVVRISNVEGVPVVESTRKVIHFTVHPFGGFHLCRLQFLGIGGICHAENEVVRVSGLTFVLCEFVMNIGKGKQRLFEIQKGARSFPHTFLGGGSCVCPKSISRIAFVAVVNMNLFDRPGCVRFHSIDRNAIIASQDKLCLWRLGKRQSPLKMGVEPERSRYFCLRCEAMIEMHCMGDSFVWMRDEFHASLDEVHGRIEVVTGA